MKGRRWMVKREVVREREVESGIQAGAQHEK
jgi:hypothetical protein